MKTIQVAPDTFDGAQFAEQYGLDAFAGDFYCERNEVGDLILNYPDALPENPVVIHTLRKTEVRKFAETIVADNLHDDVEWGKLTADEKLSRLHASFLKCAALQISGNIDLVNILRAAAGDLNA